MGCLSGLAKYILFIFNLIIVVCGILFIVFGALAIRNADKGIDDSTTRGPGIAAIVLGVIIFLIAFFGCCGAIKENSCLLGMYAGILILLFILQLALGIIVLVAIGKTDDIKSDAKTSIIDLFTNYTKDSNTAEKVDDIQQWLECCGTYGPSFWAIYYPSKYSGQLPSSCCDDDDDTSTCTTATSYQDNCIDAYSDAVLYIGKLIGGISIGFAIVELVGAIFAFVVKQRK